MGLLPSYEAQVAESTALGEGSSLAALELTNRSPFLGLFSPVSRHKAH